MPLHLLKDLRGVRSVYAFGYSYVEMRSVAIIADGKEIAIGRHEGRTGAYHKANFASWRSPPDHRSTTVASCAPESRARVLHRMETSGR